MGDRISQTTAISINLRAALPLSRRSQTWIGINQTFRHRQPTMPRSCYEIAMPPQSGI